MAIQSHRPRGTTQPRRTNRSGEPRSELAGFVIRLRQIGATDDEIAATVKTWDDFDDDWTPAARADMVRWSDVRLRDEIAALRAEYAEHTT